MTYVSRAESGEITAVSSTRAPGIEEEIASDSQELQAFLGMMGASGLAETDISFIRVLEDVIELLIAKNVIRFTDLPLPAQHKMLERQQLRDRLRPPLDLLDEERDEPLL